MALTCDAHHQKCAAHSLCLNNRNSEMHHATFTFFHSFILCFTAQTTRHAKLNGTTHSSGANMYTPESHTSPMRSHATIAIRGTPRVRANETSAFVVENVVQRLGVLLHFVGMTGV